MRLIAAVKNNHNRRLLANPSKPAGIHLSNANFVPFTTFLVNYVSNFGRDQSPSLCTSFTSEDISDTLGVLTSLREFEFMLHCIFHPIYVTGIFVYKLASRFLF